MSDTRNPLVALSDAMVEAVSLAEVSTVLVNARRRIPASGIAYAADLILTADHVVEREEDISVALPDGSEIRANLAGRDPGSDLALLRLEMAAVTPARPAEDLARPGQIVLALGRPTLAGIQASLGIISAVGGPARTGRGGFIDRYLRTDAIPFPGFSGGPLVDASGAVVGINTSGLAHGDLMAIPAGIAWETAAALAQHGHVRRGFLGIRSQPVELPEAAQKALQRQQATALLLVGIEDGGPAAASGLMLGDILVGIAGDPVVDPDDLLGHLVGEAVGRPTAVEILRGGERRAVTVIVGER